MKHNFENDDSRHWYKCTKCGIKYYNGEFVQGYGRNDYDDKLENLTCDEIIIKQIIE